MNRPKPLRSRANTANTLRSQPDTEEVFSERYSWVAVGACGLASIAFGPEESFKALGPHSHLLLFVGLLTGISILLVSLTYFRVTELFPNGGGGYAMATSLLGSRLGLVAGAALLVDYVLMVALGISASTHLMFSFLPPLFYEHRTWIAVALMAALMAFHLKGYRLNLTVFKYLFTGFLLTHLVFILVGVSDHFGEIGSIVQSSVSKTTQQADYMGWLVVLSVFARGFFLGGGTYTGIEAASDAIQMGQFRQSSERRRKLLVNVAFALAFGAASLAVLYLLWNVRAEPSMSLNGVLFEQVFSAFGWDWQWVIAGLFVMLGLETAVLLLAVHVGFVIGPRVLSTMARDSWLPHQFRYVSNRNMTRNGMVLMGLISMVAILLSRADVDLLVVLFSINVFVVFSLSMLGLTVYWWRHRNSEQWVRRLLSAALGFAVSTSILVGTVVSQFSQGGWITMVLTLGVVLICAWIRNHYRLTKQRIAKVDDAFASIQYGSEAAPAELIDGGNTAVFIVGSSRGGGLHALLWVQRMFPMHFQNFIFITARTFETRGPAGHEALDQLKTETAVGLNWFVNFCRSHGLRAKSYLSFGSDAVAELSKLAEQVTQDHPNAIFFTSKLVFEDENVFTRLLHNQAALEIQRRLHHAGHQMVILPMRL